jgi:hypothetical protein
VTTPRTHRARLLACSFSGRAGRVRSRSVSGNRYRVAELPSRVVCHRVVCRPLPSCVTWCGAPTAMTRARRPTARTLARKRQMKKSLGKRPTFRRSSLTDLLVNVPPVTNCLSRIAFTRLDALAFSSVTVTFRLSPGCLPGCLSPCCCLSPGCCHRVVCHRVVWSVTGLLVPQTRRSAPLYCSGATAM